MEQQRIDEELALPGVRELLDATSAAHLGYVGPDGAPRVVPVGYFWTGTEFVVATASTSPKVRALAARPEVSLSIVSGGGPGAARNLTVRGRARIEIVDGVVEEYLAASRRSMGPEEAAEFELRCREIYGRMARIAVTPAWARFHDFGAGRLPGFLQALVDKAGV